MRRSGSSFDPPPEATNMAELAELRAIVEAMNKSLDSLTTEVRSITKHDAQLMGGNGGGEHGTLKSEVAAMKINIAAIEARMPRAWSETQKWILGGIMSIIIFAFTTSSVSLIVWVFKENEHQIVQDGLIQNQSAAIKALQDHMDNQFANHNMRMSQEIQGIKPQR